jgi:hypothetical protein
MIPLGARGESQMALLAPLNDRVWVNGEPLLGSLRILRHRDEILVGRQLFCFSGQSHPTVFEFVLAPGSRNPRCAVCRMAVEEGQAAVACPQCARVYHQLDAVGEQLAKQCWTYRKACLCGHPTGLTEDAVWHPESDEVHG